MSTIKHNSSSHSSSKAHSSRKTEAPKANKGAEKPKDQGKDQKAEKKDGFSASKELDETKKAKDAKDKGNDKDAKKTEEGKDKGKDQDSLLKKISDLQQQLDDMKKKKPEEPENLGGCCGKSHGCKKTEDPNQKDDPDSELTKLAVAILQGGKPQPAMGGKPGEGDKNGTKAISGNPAQMKSELSQKYQQYKQQGVQLRPETEQLVESALKGGGSTSTNPTNPTNDKNNPTGNNKQTNNNQPRPLAKAS